MDQGKNKPSSSDLVCTLEGSWKGKIYYTKADSKEQTLLVDLNTLLPFEKIVAPEYERFPKPSRTVWKDVTANIIAQNFNEATKFKRIVEEEQRRERAEMANRNEQFQSYWFWFLDDSGLGGASKERDATDQDKGAGLAGKPYLRSIRSKEAPWAS